MMALGLADTRAARIMIVSAQCSNCSFDMKSKACERTAFVICACIPCGEEVRKYAIPSSCYSYYLIPANKTFTLPNACEDIECTGVFLTISGVHCISRTSLNPDFRHNVRISYLDPVLNKNFINREGLTIVASVLLIAPTRNDSQGPIFVDESPLARRIRLLTRSNTPYVIAGLTVNTNPGLRPSHKPVTPSSSTISRATPRKESSTSSFLDRSGRPTCCRVAITETGRVKICARAPAAAPSKSSAAVDKGGSLAPGGSFCVSRFI